MRSVAAVLLLFGAVSCQKEPEISPVERGTRVFTPAAETLGVALAVDLKSKNETAYKQYLEETQTRNEKELGSRIAGQILARYGPPLSLTAEQEKAIQAGKFDDAGNLKKVNAAVGRFADRKLMIPEACQIAMLRVQSGEWKSGLQLEFAARMLEGHFGLPNH